MFTRLKQPIVWISIGLILAVLIGALAIWRFVPNRDAGQQAQEALSREVDQARQDTDRLLPDLASLDRSVDISEYKLAPASGYEVFEMGTLDDGQVILSIPLKNLQESYYKPLISEFPVLTQLQQKNRLQTRQILFYNPITQKYSLPKENLDYLAQFRSGGKTRWFYGFGNRYWVSDPGFLAAERVYLEDHPKFGTLAEIKQTSTNSPVFWVRTSDPGIRVGVNDIQNFLRVDLRLSLGQQVVTRVASSFLVQDEARSMDGELEKSYVSSQTTSRLANTAIGNSKAQGIHLLEAPSVRIYPLGETKLMVQSSYFTENFWILDFEEEYPVPKLLEESGERQIGFVFTACDEVLTCYILNARKKTLGVFKPLEGGAVTRGDVGEILAEVDALGVTRSTQALGYDNSRLFRLQNNRPVFWYLGQDYNL